jgi:hypothetical protein
MIFVFVRLSRNFIFGQIFQLTVETGLSLIIDKAQRHGDETIAKRAS